jgi:hypothetical protein
MMGLAREVFSSQPEYRGLDPDDFRLRLDVPTHLGHMQCWLCPEGAFAFTWTKALSEGVVSKLARGITLDPSEWSTGDGIPWIVDLCATPGLSGKSVGLALRRIVVATQIAREGEVVVFRRATGAVPGRCGHFIARG